jgi:hypothetical protein
MKFTQPFSNYIIFSQRNDHWTITNKADTVPDAGDGADQMRVALQFILLAWT